MSDTPAAAAITAEREAWMTEAKLLLRAVRMAVTRQTIYPCSKNVLACDAADAALIAHLFTQAAPVAAGLEAARKHDAEQSKASLIGAQPAPAAPSEMTFRDTQELLAKVRYKDWSFRLSREGAHAVLQVIIPAHDVKTGEVTTWTGRKWRLSAFMTPSEVVQTAFKAVLTAEEHEAREAFLYQGRPIFGPHYNVDALWAIATEENEDTRPKA